MPASILKGKSLSSERSNSKMIPFLEDLLMLSYQSTWKSTLSRLSGVFGNQFGLEWRKTEKEFWEKFEKDLEIKESTIVES